MCYSTTALLKPVKRGNYSGWCIWCALHRSWSINFHFLPSLQKSLSPPPQTHSRNMSFQPSLRPKATRMTGSQNPPCNLLLWCLWIIGQQTSQDAPCFHKWHPQTSLPTSVSRSAHSSERPEAEQTIHMIFFFPKAIDICCLSLRVPGLFCWFICCTIHYRSSLIPVSLLTMGPFLKKTLWSIAHGMYSKKTKYDPLSNNALESTNCHNQYRLSQYARASQHSQQLFWHS